MIGIINQIHGGNPYEQPKWLDQAQPLPAGLRNGLGILGRLDRQKFAYILVDALKYHRRYHGNQITILVCPYLFDIIVHEIGTDTPFTVFGIEFHLKEVVTEEEGELLAFPQYRRRYYFQPGANEPGICEILPSPANQQKIPA